MWMALRSFASLTRKRRPPKSVAKDVTVADEPKQRLDHDGRPSLVGEQESLALDAPSIPIGAKDTGVALGLAAQVAQVKATQDLGDDHDNRMTPVDYGACEILGALIADEPAKGVPGSVFANYLKTKGLDAVG